MVLARSALQKGSQIIPTPMLRCSLTQKLEHLKQLACQMAQAVPSHQKAPPSTHSLHNQAGEQAVSSPLETTFVEPLSTILDAMPSMVSRISLGHSLTQAVALCLTPARHKLCNTCSMVVCMGRDNALSHTHYSLETGSTTTLVLLEPSFIKATNRWNSDISCDSSNTHWRCS